MTAYITRAQLTAMVNACPVDTLAGKRDRLLLVVLRALEGRSGQLTALHVDEAKPRAAGGLMVRGLTINAEVPAEEFSDHDPVALFIDWMAEYCPRFSSQPLFCAITKDDRIRIGRWHLTPASVTRIVKRAAARAGLDNPEQYSARSLRGVTRQPVAPYRPMNPARRKVGQ